jgi:hypothetical protein
MVCEACGEYNARLVDKSSQTVRCKSCGHYYLNLHCDDATRDARLRARPGWRRCTEEFIAEHRKFARWLLENAPTAFDPPMPTVDTTDTPVPEVALQIRDWARKHWVREMESLETRVRA